MHPAVPPRQAGFTLVEMLVALAIFALLAAAGVGVLRASIDTQSAVDRRLAELGEFGRLHALLSADLGQAVARPTRGAAGERPEFSGEPSGMAFVRAGWDNLDQARRSDLQRVEWRLGPEGFARLGHALLDGDGDGDAAPAVLLRDTRSAELRYRHSDGQWTSAFRSSPEEPLPAAVELRVERRGEAPVTFVYALPPSAPSSPNMVAAS